MFPFQCVLVTGASGFVGRNLCRLFAERGIGYVAMARQTSKVAPLEALGATIRRADLGDREAVRRALAGCDAVVHLAAAADVSDVSVNRRVNVGGVKTLIGACEAQRCRRVLFFSTNCATRELRDAYAITKMEGERLFAGADLEVTVFRPTMIYGAESREWRTFVGAVRRLPLVPVIGHGRHTVRPVALPDVLQAVVKALARPIAIGRTYDLAGPTSISFNDLVQLVARVLGLRRRIIHLPVGLSRFGARLMGKAMKHPPVTVDQVLAFAQDTCADIDPARRDLDFTPRTIESGLAQLLPRMCPPRS